MQTTSSKQRGILWLIAGWLLLVAAVIGLSLLRSQLQQAPAEESPQVSSITVAETTTVGELARTAPLSPQVVAKALGVKLPEQARLSISDLGLSAPQAQAKLMRTLALRAEHESKDFRKIRLKFALWLVALTIPAVLLLRRQLSSTWRYILLATSVAVFGVWLGSDPSPMGTVKDAIVLGGKFHAVFPPRMVALGIFLLLVVAANKFICSWGCQFGTLQELLYRLNQRGRHQRPVLPVFRLPYAISNSIRGGIFVALTGAAFIWAFDLLGPVDPFKVYSPLHLSWIGGACVLLLLLLSPVLYRPWCNLACPFGLVSWVFERLSVLRPRVDYAKCIACHACENACPTAAMRGLLRGHAMPQDCFSCGDCLRACPTGAVRYTHPWRKHAAAERSEKVARLRKV